ncbi:glycoside hydrolase family 29 protein [Mycena rebaudengoi]|nr:glycoside hydrolase family 29 protein [Mycena rebaudengoi]
MDSAFSFNGINFMLPPFHSAASSDAIQSISQKFTVNGVFQSFHALGAAVWPPSSFSQARAGNLTFNFVDVTNLLHLGDHRRSVVQLHPRHYANRSLDWNTIIDLNITLIHYVTSRIPNAKALKSIILPTESTQINFFSISIVPAVTVGSESNLNLQFVRSTTKHMHSDPSLQQIEIFLYDLALLDSTNWITSPHIVTVNFLAVETVILSVENNDGGLATHEAPEWFDGAKFGNSSIGTFTVYPRGHQPGNNMRNGRQFHNSASASSPTWVHRRQTYRPGIVYDNFIANFTASARDPDAWTDLFADAGAKYFVLVSKHHEGFAIFDTGNSSNRNSVQMGPKRDILEDLSDYAPDARTKFPGRPALSVERFRAVILISVTFLCRTLCRTMEKLFYEYDTEILWCDADGGSAFPSIGGGLVQLRSITKPRSYSRNRCGSNQTDFITPEYVTFPARLVSHLFSYFKNGKAKDPFSYGYNSDTPPENYAKAIDLIVELVDIPQESGPLLQIGYWMRTSGEAIHGTTPWYIQPAEDPAGNDVRFTTTEGAFYIIASVTIKDGDVVTLLGGDGKPFAWSNTGQILTISVPQAQLNNLKYYACRGFQDNTTAAYPFSRTESANDGQCQRPHSPEMVRVVPQQDQFDVSQERDALARIARAFMTRTLVDDWSPQ